MNRFRRTRANKCSVLVWLLLTLVTQLGAQSGRLALAVDYRPGINWLAAKPGLPLQARLSEILVEGVGKDRVAQTGGKKEMTKIEFEIIEGRFHDGLGTFAELMLANNLIERAQSPQPRFDLARSLGKMQDALNRLPDAHPARKTFEREIANIRAGSAKGAAELLGKVESAKLIAVRHVAREYAGARAADLLLEFSNHLSLPISVKTDKSGKVAIAEGQTPEIGRKWAERYFQVSEAELQEMAQELGFSSMVELKGHYLNVARLVAQILIRKLGLIDCQPTDFSRARVTNLAAAKYLFRQLLRYKQGSDGSQVIIFDRATGEVKWESQLDSVDIEELTSERISFRPSRPRGERQSGSEFGIKIDGKAMVTFQIKHKRGLARDTSRRNEFSDITTRLIL